MLIAKQYASVEKKASYSSAPCNSKARKILDEVRLCVALLLPSDDSSSSLWRCSSVCDLLRGRIESQHHLMAESRAEDSTWDPSSARPPSQPAKTREESACLSLAPPVVQMTQFGIAHTHRLAHGPIHSRPHTGWALSLCDTRARTHTHTHTGRSCASPLYLKLRGASRSARPSVSTRLSVGPAPLFGGGLRMWGAGAFRCSSAGSTSQLPHCSSSPPSGKLIRSRVPGPSAGTRLIQSLRAHLLFINEYNFFFLTFFLFYFFLL